jgi:hypothetical protein
MRVEYALLRTGEYLVRRACRRLPPDIRDDRYREWTAELPAILHDPQIRLGRTVPSACWATRPTPCAGTLQRGGPDAGCLGTKP